MKRWLPLLLALFLTLSPVAYAQEEDGSLWYEDQAIALVQELDVLIHDESYGSLYGISSTAGDLVDEVGRPIFPPCPKARCGLRCQTLMGCCRLYCRSQPHLMEANSPKWPQNVFSITCPLCSSTF